MATFKAEIYKHQKKANGTWNVKIRITHNREKKYLSTSIYATKDDLTRTFKLKSQDIIEETEAIISSYRDACNKLGTRANSMTVEDIVDYVTGISDEKQREIDFISFSNTYIESIKSTGTARNYKSAINSLTKFAKRDRLNISEITAKFLSNYADFINLEKSKRNIEAIKNDERITSNRALTLYMGCIRHLYNEAKRVYNDEDGGKILIPWSPFSKYKVPRDEATRKRAIEAEAIKKIYELPYKMRKNARTKSEQNCRYNLAKDMFLLSFGLIGMNSADLYTCSNLSNGTIIYNREKTKSRRADEAEIHVDITPAISALVEKYRDRTGKRVFNFYQMYRDTNTFNQAINKGLKEIGKELGIEDLEFYAARHSWATIAINDVKIDKYTVHAALNHVDESMKVTDIYIKKDFTAINEANRKVLDLVFGEKVGD